MDHADGPILHHIANPVRRVCMHMCAFTQIWREHSLAMPVINVLLTTDLVNTVHDACPQNSAVRAWIRRYCPGSWSKTQPHFCMDVHTSTSRATLWQVVLGMHMLKQRVVNFSCWNVHCSVNKYSTGFF